MHAKENGSLALYCGDEECSGHSLSVVRPGVMRTQAD